jgi:hypothetical protein
MKILIKRQYIWSIIVSAIVLIASINVSGAINGTNMKDQLFLLSIVASIMMMIGVAAVSSLNFSFNENTKEFLISFDIPIIIWSIVVGLGLAGLIFDRDSDPTGFFFSGSSIVPLLFNVWTRKRLKRLSKE